MKDNNQNKKDLIEAFPVGEVRFINTEEDKDTVVLVKIEEGLLMTIEEYERCKEAVMKGEVLRLRAY